MKVLLLHPEDTPWLGGWKNHKWDLVVDFGWAGPHCYERWARELKTPVVSLYDFQQPVEIFRTISQMIEGGRNRLIDSRGLDWWEIQGASKYQLLQVLCLIGRLRDHIGEGAEVQVSRWSPLCNVLRQAWRKEIPHFGQPENKKLQRSVVSRLRRLTPAQGLEIAFDKWDPHYQWRRRWPNQRRAAATGPVVLLPSPYVNVARTVVAYASLLPEQKFLLVSTRRNGTYALPPTNVLTATLAAYAVPAEQTSAESASLIERWHQFSREVLCSAEQLKWAYDANLLADIPSLLTTGLSVRDAWQSLFDQEPVESVLCADDLNVYTRIPQMLASQIGIRTVYCAHGALDSVLASRKSYADVHMVKGEMEADFLVNACGIPAETVMKGAPISFHAAPRRPPEAGAPIVFFSQPYEIVQGRADEAYREILPKLCDLARKAQCKVIVKLHPFESRLDRSRLIKATVPPSDQGLIEITRRRFASEVIRDAWFGISVNSSVAVECTLERIPFFNCGWLETKDTGYAAQFSKFGAGILMNHPSEIYQIPDLLGAGVSEKIDFSDSVLRKLSEPLQPGTLKQVLFGGAPLRDHARARENNSPQPPPGLAGSLLRKVVYPSLGASGFLKRWRSGHQGTIAVLTYHGVIPQSYFSDDRFMDDGLLQAEAFRHQLRFLKSNYSVITPDDFRLWLQGRKGLPSRAALLTCDDGLLNNVTQMLPLLVEEDLKCLFFITGYSLRKQPRMAWYLRLYRLLMLARQPVDLTFNSRGAKSTLDPGRNRHAIWRELVRTLSKDDDNIREDHLDHIRRTVGAPEDWESRYCEDPILRQRYL
ncbi:MAG: polysaccharide deacetylase family protein, partial [Acidobacteriales bacterium]|nr:polysaccharide deacetylase family protein [Terriglobales bacterium]